MTLSLPPFTFAYQPVVNAATKEVFAHEALVRGSEGESAASIFKAIDPCDLPAADGVLCVEAIGLAAKLGLTSIINLNMMPSSLQQAQGPLTDTIAAAERVGIVPAQLMLEITESEVIQDLPRFAEAIDEYRYHGVKFAIDDFGAGYAGLNLLAEFQPDVVKVDMHLVRSIERRGPRQAIVRGITRTCVDLGIDIIAEGVETYDEFCWFMDEGITLFQGYLFAKPSFRELTTSVHMPAYLGID